MLTCESELNKITAPTASPSYTFSQLLSPQPASPINVLEEADQSKQIVALDWRKWCEPEDIWGETPVYEEIEDLRTWIVEYRLRLFHTEFEGRNRERDKAVLLTLTLLMEHFGEREFEVSTADLATYTGAHRKTFWAAITDLRRLGFVRALGVVRKDEAGKADIWMLTLFADKLALLQECESLPETVMTAVLRGDFSHDAFAGHKGFKPSRRAVWLYLLAHPGVTMYAISKEKKLSHATVQRIIPWLVEQGLARRTEEGKCFALEPRREQATLEAIAVRNYLQDKTEKRVKYATFDLEEIKTQRQRQQEVATTHWQNYVAKSSRDETVFHETA